MAHININLNESVPEKVWVAVSEEGGWADRDVFIKRTRAEVDEIEDFLGEPLRKMHVSVKQLVPALRGRAGTKVTVKGLSTAWGSIADAFRQEFGAVVADALAMRGV